MPKTQLGLAPILIVLILAVIAGSSVLVIKNMPFNQPKPVPAVRQSTDSAQVKVSQNPIPTPVPTLTPKPPVASSQIPVIDCVGPDGKHARATKQDCDNLWKYWATPTPLPTATPAPQQVSSDNSSSNSGCNSGGVSVNIQPNSGSVVGDTIVRVTVRSSPQCNSGYSSDQILRNGASSATFSGLPPGTYNLFVTYHGNQYNESFDITAGNNTSKTVNVNN